MIKKISVLLGFVAMLFAGLTLAQGTAVVTTAVGTTQVQTGAGTPRSLRVGDEVRQGDTVSTGARSSLVLRFEDGEVTALTQNSRMIITAYQYEPTSRTGNMLLSLVTGGMRAVTGLLGGSHPERVSYRAATATIGVRGTDVTIITDGTNVEISVIHGDIVLTFNGVDYPIHEGQTASIQAGKVTYTAITAGPLAATAQFDRADLVGMTNQINQALASGTPATGTSSGTTPGTNVPPGGAGGGSASVR